MSEMIERVARAIYFGAYPKFKFENDAQHIRDHYREVARAAIEAMRSPTEAMQDAGDEHDYTCAIWHAMIDEALKGSDGAGENQPETRTGPHRASGETNSGATGDSELTRSARPPSDTCSLSSKQSGGA